MLSFEFSGPKRQHPEWIEQRATLNPRKCSNMDLGLSDKFGLCSFFRGVACPYIGCWDWVAQQIGNGIQMRREAHCNTYLQHPRAVQLGYMCCVWRSRTGTSYTRWSRSSISMPHTRLQQLDSQEALTEKWPLLHGIIWAMDPKLWQHSSIFCQCQVQEGSRRSSKSNKSNTFLWLGVSFYPAFLNEGLTTCNLTQQLMTVASSGLWVLALLFLHQRAYSPHRCASPRGFAIGLTKMDAQAEHMQ